jgi:hypothetical protein
LNSNEIDENRLKEQRYDEPRISTFQAMLIDPSDHDENAPHLIRVNHELYFKEIDESEFKQ